MRTTTRLTFLTAAFLSSGLGCEQIASVDRGKIVEGAAGFGGGGIGGGSAGGGGIGGAGGIGGGSGGAGGSGGVVCVMPSDCPPTGNECLVAICSNGFCAQNAVAAGTPVGAQTAGDCKTNQCDGAGNVAAENNDADLPVDGDACTLDVCTSGAPSNPPAAVGAACPTGYCDAAGACVECVVASTCPGMDMDCRVRSCINATCGTTDLPAGTAAMNQTQGDCHLTVCDGAGASTTTVDITDVPVDNNTCTDNLCDAQGTPSNPNSASGAACNQNGGKVCNGSGACVECLVNADCASGICNASVCQASTVVDTTPADGAMNVLVGASVGVIFSGAMAPATLTAQTSAGACTGTVQISIDDFTSCLSVATATPTMSGNGTTATFALAPGLSYANLYKVRVTTAAQDTSGKPIAMTYTSTTGFTTEAAPVACVGGLAISQVYGSGGNTGANWKNDFIELHNRSTMPISVAGWSVQYSSAAGTSWATTALTGTIPPGGYYLVQEAAGAGMAPALPTPDATGTIAMAALAGKIALVNTTTALTGACPVGPQIVDLVGYGMAASCSEGMAPAAVPPTAADSNQRTGDGCTDTNNNNHDFAQLTTNPRNSMTTAALCMCSANESGVDAEIDYCNVQFPTSLSLMPGQMSPTVYGRVYEATITDPAGPSAIIVGELGLGPANVNPTTQSGYTFFPTTFNVQMGNDDEYQASLTAPMTPGSYRYVYRFTKDGQKWTYCDLNGAGSDPGLTFDLTQLPVLTVAP